DSPEMTTPGMFTAATRSPDLRKPHTLTLRGTLLRALPRAGVVPPEHPARTARAAAARTASAGLLIMSLFPAGRRARRAAGGGGTGEPACHRRSRVTRLAGHDLGSVWFDPHAA